MQIKRDMPMFAQFVYQHYLYYSLFVCSVTAHYRAQTINALLNLNIHFRQTSVPKVARWLLYWIIYWIRFGKVFDRSVFFSILFSKNVHFVAF